MPASTRKTCAVRVNVLVTCEVCGAATPTEIHEFRVGLIRYPPPPADWEIRAPLYFLASSDGRTAAAVFCSPNCSLRYHQNKVPSPCSNTRQQRLPPTKK